MRQNNFPNNSLIEENEQTLDPAITSLQEDHNWHSKLKEDDLAEASAKRAQNYILSNR